MVCLSPCWHREFNCLSTLMSPARLLSLHGWQPCISDEIPCLFSLGCWEMRGCAERWTSALQGFRVWERGGGGASGLRRLLPPPFLMLSESFLASFCDQPVLERLQQMANYHNAQSFWGSWVQTQAWPSQEQLHLTQHVEPTLGFTHTPILTFPMGRLMARFRTDGQEKLEGKALPTSCSVPFPAS